jgi:hypothetical protein
MSDEDTTKQSSADGEAEPVVSLTDFFDQLERRSFTRALDQRHPLATAARHDESLDADHG